MSATKNASTKRPAARRASSGAAARTTARTRGDAEAAASNATGKAEKRDGDKTSANGNAKGSGETNAAASIQGAARKGGESKSEGARSTETKENGGDGGAKGGGSAKAESGRADDHKAKVAAQEGKKAGAGDDGIDMAPPVTLTIDGEKLTLDIDDPKLPDWIEEREFSSDGYPYDKRLKKKRYEKELDALQGEMVKMQGWLRDSGERLVLVFEGRDAAGKGGTIAAFREYLNPRAARIVALAKPTRKEQGQWYFQRYVEQFPTTGEMVLFDRSWYNRAGVEPVMGFVSDEKHRQFLHDAPAFERLLTGDGIHLFKLWLNVGQAMQIARFHARRHNPLKSWKLSPIDIEALTLWDRYTAMRDLMLAETSTSHAPWTIVRSNDKRRARLNAMRHVLMSLDYENKDEEAIGEIDTKIVGEGPPFLNTFGA